MIRTAIRRIDRLENRLGIAAAKRPCSVVVATRAGCKLALDEDACLQILRESGFLPDGPHFAAVNLLQIPDGLNAGELKRFLRENGAKICGFSTQNHCASAAADVRRDGGPAK
jgi:hypothetical protein